MRHLPRLALAVALASPLVACDETPTSPDDTAPCFHSIDTLTVTTLPADFAGSGTLGAASCKLGRGSYADRWMIDVQVTTNVVITQGSTDFVAMFYLRDANDYPVTRGEDPGPGTEAQLEYHFVPGIYYVLLTTEAKNRLGDYTLAIHAAP